MSLEIPILILFRFSSLSGHVPVSIVAAGCFNYIGPLQMVLGRLDGFRLFSLVPHFSKYQINGIWLLCSYLYTKSLLLITYSRKNTDLRMYQAGAQLAKRDGQRRRVQACPVFFLKMRKKVLILGKKTLIVSIFWVTLSLKMQF